jgi:glutathione S-transferase
MLILRSSPPSPFARKIRIGAAILGLTNRIEVVQADTNDPEEPLRRQNPLGKIPTLVLEDGTALFDSRVILEYLDFLTGGGRIVPSAPGPRLAALTMQALADGLIDAAILQVYETRFRDAERYSAKWLDHQAGKVTRALAALESSPPAEGGRDVGAISVACALGYLDLRFNGRWREGHPKLVRWLETFAAGVPAFAATRVAPA